MHCDFSRVTICGESKLNPSRANYLNFKTELKKERGIDIGEEVKIPVNVALNAT